MTKKARKKTEWICIGCGALFFPEPPNYQCPKCNGNITRENTASTPKRTSTNGVSDKSEIIVDRNTRIRAFLVGLIIIISVIYFFYPHLFIPPWDRLDIPESFTKNLKIFIEVSPGQQVDNPEGSFSMLAYPGHLSTWYSLIRSNARGLYFLEGTHEFEIETDDKKSTINSEYRVCYEWCASFHIRWGDNSKRTSINCIWLSADLTIEQVRMFYDNEYNAVKVSISRVMFEGEQIFVRDNPSFVKVQYLTTNDIL